MQRKLEWEFSEWPWYRVKPAATYCTAKLAQVKARCFSRRELLRVKNFDRFQRKL